ncbi:Uncharacterized protein OS=Candidatus Entotheonella sp. TSY2 GN=ETSY2_22115 PE=4 SV=1 [Gemmata massiliana]|uniref:Uncharacterized protein n=1 Tax=Gemmata massiliana TaxID=1210884 RepID=A0A6P2D2Z7_9BACT|nr:hypothetical protein [Gemmata massiliana]VTR95671.1 Uncharacterized protein OS=Candidatus Entotheonella sp. TSY2 GN=ETSY2_22115 PE=4 SV=1 [Gemmata massiliana]
MDGPLPIPDPHAPAGFVALNDPRRTEFLVEALKVALHNAGEHRLFQSGKLPGLFPARTGLAAEAALQALREGLLETVRTEAKGKLITEWVCATPKAVGYVHEHDSPRSILRELKDVLQATRTGVPAFMEEAKAELAALSANFEKRAAEMLGHLNDLAKRCEAALRRAETSGPIVTESVGRVVPWAVDALEYLDRRTQSGATGDCPLPELFHAVCVRFPELTLPAFHDGVRRLHDVRAVRLTPTSAIPEPEYAVVVEGKLMYAVGR